MEKIATSLACQSCGSSNIRSVLEFCDAKTEYDKCLNAEITTKHRIYNCKCRNCQKKYTVDHGIDKFTLYKSPYKINCLGDVKLLAEYESQSAFIRNYEICSITATNAQEIYLIFTENDKYPIVVSNQDIAEIVNKPEKARILTKNIFLNRYR